METKPPKISRAQHYALAVITLLRAWANIDPAKAREIRMLIGTIQYLSRLPEEL